LRREKMDKKAKEKLLLYISQGKALQELLKKTDISGSNQKKIEDIEKKLQKAFRKLSTVNRRR
jgi:dephospho-CoA kinase